MPRLHADELPIDVALVRGLVDRSFPEYADDELWPLGDSGSSNALFRLGQGRVVRLPQQPGGGEGIAKEASWLPYVGSRVSVQVPAVVAVGESDRGYPERWAIASWLYGSRPSRGPSASARSRSSVLAHDLARFLRELRAMEVPRGAREDAALSSYRGLPLWHLDTEFREAAAACRNLGLDLDVAAALRVWDRATECSRATHAGDTWLHGDLLAENLLVDRSGGLSAVLDFGGLSLGDPTVDLVVAWEVLDKDARQVFRRAVGVDESTWTVSRGWALLIALITFPYYGTSMPQRCCDRLTMATAALSGD